jgi:hypothetical protein
MVPAACPNARGRKLVENNAIKKEAAKRVSFRE